MGFRIRLRFLIRMHPDDHRRISSAAIRIEGEKAFRTIRTEDD